MRIYLLPLVIVMFLASCNEKPVTIDDPRNHPERYRKVDTATTVKMQEVLKQDVYLNDLDPNAGMDIQPKTITMFYYTEQDSTETIYEYVVDQKLDGQDYKDEGVSFLHLKKDGQVLDYKFLANNRDVLRFEYVKDGTVHEYFPKNRPTAPPVILPD
ncbi:hypothetical protein [Nonlabens ponticola]|uniref:Lipoprotein n=1 Tax=Nonlabens ponticola TaxID=2496866 RepID=A0A3S9MZI5_9FLAO|nr:hypothetical protein [Nonlabens ponticola]AZQ44568.1 hypothetical protein EJ995_10045 [Nonlabens ponticola]